MAKKEYFPPLLTTFSNCKDYFFLARAPTHFVYILLWLTGERAIKAAGQRFSTNVLSQFDLVFTSGLIALIALFLVHLIICSYTRLWAGPSGIVWRSLWGKGVVPWQEIRDYDEQPNVLLPKLRVTAEGTLLFPSSFVGSMTPFRQAMQLKGIPCRISDPHDCVWRRNPSWEEMKGLGWGGLFLGMLTTILESNGSNFIELFLCWFGLAVFCGWAVHATGQRLKRVRCTGSYLQQTLLPLLPTQILDCSLAEIQPSYRVGGGLPSEVVLTGRDQAGKRVTICLSQDILNFEGICRRLESHYPNLVLRLDQTGCELS